MKKNVLITGGSGFVGTNLTKMLLDNGYTVSILTRTSKPSTGDIRYYLWDVESQTIEEAAVLNADYVVHLAGENIADKRWTAKRKSQIIDSRIQSAQLIRGVLQKHNKKLNAFVSASGIGIYGAKNGEGVCTEDTAPANDFIGMVCQEWEKSADSIADLGIRTVKIRTGLVLGKEEGFLKKLTPIFKSKLGSAIGSGNQYMPWIHIHDLCSIYLEALKNDDLSGVYNATINDSTTNSSFSKALANYYGYTIWLPKVPAFVIKLMLGEMSIIVLTGRRVSSDKIKSVGFRFEFTDLQMALEDCLQE